MNSIFSILFLTLFFSFVASVESASIREKNKDDNFTGSKIESHMTGESLDDELQDGEEFSKTEKGRFRRATCDLLSFSTKLGSVNHAACAAHCLAMRKGYRGGYCSKGVCRCRK